MFHCVVTLTSNCTAVMGVCIFVFVFVFLFWSHKIQYISKDFWMLNPSCYNNYINLIHNKISIYRRIGESNNVYCV